MKTLTLATLLVSLTSMTALATPADSVRVKGDSEAIAICKAVLKNDAKSLDNRLERYHKQDRVRAKYLKKHHPALLEDFSCNGKSLLEFAELTDSSNVARYLISYSYGTPTVYVDDVAAN
jgi:hypothetical protein